MNADLAAVAGTDSPFDAIRRADDGGVEYWSARELMPLLGYENWQNFESAIDRAMIAANNAGYESRDHFIGASKLVKSGIGATRKIMDYRLSRFGAYLIAMNSDPRKAQVAEAQSYFAIRTRQAETAPAPQFQIPKTYADALRAAAYQVERAELAEQQSRMLAAKVEHDAPKVAKAEAHSACDTDIHRQAFAREVQQWGKTIGVTVIQEQVYELLRRKGMLVGGLRSDRNHATSHAVQAGWARTVKGVTEDGHQYATTKLLPRGQDIAWKWITGYVADHGDLRMGADA